MDFEQLLEGALEEVGRNLGDTKDEVMMYVAERAAHLAALSAAGEPGFDEALRVERNNVAMKLGIDAIRSADHVDQRIVGVIYGGLAMLAGGAA